MNKASGYGELTLNGKELSFKFGALAYRLLCEYRHIELSELSALMKKDLYSVVELGYFAHVADMRIKDKPPEVSLEWFIDAVGDSKEALPFIEETLSTAMVWGYNTDDIDVKKNP